jgi:hypothetical protein
MQVEAERADMRKKAGVNLPVTLPEGSLSPLLRVRVLAPSDVPCGPFPALCRDDAVVLGSP